MFAFYIVYTNAISSYLLFHKQINKNVDMLDSFTKILKEYYYLALMVFYRDFKGKTITKLKI